MLVCEVEVMMVLDVPYDRVLTAVGYLTFPVLRG